MTVDVLTRDHGFRRWLAMHPGLWLEVGVFDDAGQLVTLEAERRRLCLPPIAASCAPHARRKLRRGHSVPARASVFNATTGGRP
ncbi:hypothetical protein KZX46_21380 (plasmid) [Polymorphobacter sp. PAMC 29334]|uniref:hypothetical protein n=1 Tax=Polymorphobacter sp. PAMC 29334 TaxID=2862331 RepID=UPI001C748D4E|nr:hypothetical protein [Polymorphobacter sp. PAMC 29334]QYE37192.1 hypothetical protein KZX46_21380 [Polymorphobacter sp. PAMC 29334]